LKKLAGYFNIDLEMILNPFVQKFLMKMNGFEMSLTLILLLNKKFQEK